jgi:hypothetical protein
MVCTILVVSPLYTSTLVPRLTRTTGGPGALRGDGKASLLTYRITPFESLRYWYLIRSISARGVLNRIWIDSDRVYRLYSIKIKW